MFLGVEMDTQKDLILYTPGGQENKEPDTTLYQGDDMSLFL